MMGTAAQLERVLSELQKKLEQYQTKHLNEANTKAVFVHPLLAALGWQVGDLDAVEEQFPVPGGTFVDYALKIDDAPVVFVEAKPLQEALDDPKWIAQTINYAHNQDVDWCVLTNGAEWRCYKSSEKGKMEEKLLFRAHVAQPETRSDLALLSKDGVPQALEREAERCFVLRRVKDALKGIVTEALQGLVSLIRKRVSDTSSKQIRAALERLEVVEADIPPPPPPNGPEGLISRSGALPNTAALLREAHREIHRLGSDVTSATKERYVRYYLDGRSFCAIKPGRSMLYVYLYLHPVDLRVGEGLRVRDMTGPGRHPAGPTRITYSNRTQTAEVMSAIRASCDSVRAAVTSGPADQREEQRPEVAYNLESLLKRSRASAEGERLLRAMDRAIMGLGPDVVGEVKKWYVRYEVGGKTFGSVVPLKSTLRAFVYVPPSELPGAVDQTLVRDVSGVGHYGVGDTEIRCADHSELDSAVTAMRASYEKVRGSA